MFTTIGTVGYSRILVFFFLISFEAKTAFQALEAPPAKMALQDDSGDILIPHGIIFVFERV
ncbi:MULTISPECIES: hypothetical protein [Rhizobium]|uniref:hypothetical protein n=1 Tax=Rhizobium TaxID=379 RepID=UPI000DA78B73|nr:MULTISPECIES: hypothetical protein [Rhizobium]MBO9102376.1 hypothetical protein [Rhizobium sp. L58/93]MBO9172413.1 hypothetical protein [Rhizobium sp. L245/93]MBO9188201.1 hypothetical protein [Rhizobium sp. E27B/91]QXZ87563.1 hypothetical protein J5287_28120 [Rhizobium sp. K1/93]QYA05098.1 hypothetical protein J5278_25990 [Rhizobium sp. B21/90]